MKALSKLFIINGIGLAACLALALVLVKPSVGKLASINAELRDKKTQAKTLDQQLLAYKSAQSDLSRATDRDRIMSAVLDRENLVDVIKNVEAAADRTSSTHSISIVDPEPTAKLPPAVVKGMKDVTEVQYTLTTKNEFNGTLDFLKYLEHLPHFTEITRMRLTADVAAGTNNTTVRTGNVLTTYEGIFFVKGAPITAAPAKSNATQTQAE